MALINEHYRKLQTGYLFPEISRRVETFERSCPAAEIIRLGIGDVTQPLVPVVVDALKKASAEMATDTTFRGYGPEPGYEFLRSAICEQDYLSRGVEISTDEVFVSDGSKQDSGNIQEIFGNECSICVTDPAYPVYVDTNVMAGRTGTADSDGKFTGIIYVTASEENLFTPRPPTERADLAYLCSPNNPTGSVMTREILESWILWARENSAIIIYDEAYDAFINDPSLPKSIFEIDGSRECAIEMRSFSKRAGFTGVRCAYTTIPKELRGQSIDGEQIPIRELWSRRQATKFNSVPYIVQRAAEAALSKEGRKQTARQVDYYRENAKLLREGLTKVGFSVFGGVHAPYIWIQTPTGLSSWDFFDRLLIDSHVVGTPGVGFGPAGEGYLRLSAFNSSENVLSAIKRIENRFEKLKAET